MRPKEYGSVTTGDEPEISQSTEGNGGRLKSGSNEQSAETGSLTKEAKQWRVFLSCEMVGGFSKGNNAVSDLRGG